MQPFIRPRKLKWRVAQCPEMYKVNSPDHGLKDAEEIHEAAVVSTLCSHHQDRAINHKDPMSNHLQQGNSRDKGNTHQWERINAVVAKVGIIGLMIAHHLNKVISVVDVVVGTREEEPQEEEEEEEVYNVDKDAIAEISLYMPP